MHHALLSLLLQSPPLSTHPKKTKYSSLNITSLGDPNFQTMFNMQHNGKTWRNRMTFNHLNAIIPEYSSCNCLHLKES